MFGIMVGPAQDAGGGEYGRVMHGKFVGAHGRAAPLSDSTSVGRPSLQPAIPSIGINVTFDRITAWSQAVLGPGSAR